MLTYALMLTIVGVLAIVSMTIPKRARWMVTGITATILIIFMGLRDRVSADWNQYVTIFKTYSSLPFSMARNTFPIEVGFGALNVAAGAVGGDIHLVAFTCAAVMVIGLLYFVISFNVNPVLALFVACPYLLFVVGMGYMRQSAAIGFSFASITFFKEKRWIPFGIFALLALLFHNSSILMLAILLASTWKRLLFIGIAGVGVLSMPGMLGDGGKYSGYVTEAGGVVQASGVYMRIAVVACAFVLLWMQRKRWRRETEVYGYMKRAAVVLLLLAPFSSLASSMVDRFALYLFFVYLLVMAKSIEFAPITYQWITLVSVYGFSYVIFFIWFLTSTYAKFYWVPYHIAIPQFLHNLGG
jgi:hypothetical protein